MANIPMRHRANPLFILVGLVLILGGIALTVYGVAYIFRIMSGFDPFRGDGPPDRTADGATMAFWGIIVLTIGRYFWRGARRRGARDRFGRLLIISGYAVLGVALDRGVHAAVGLWHTSSAQSAQSAALNAVITFAIWAVPAAILAGIGLRLAKEEALAQAGVTARTWEKRVEG
ncbi:hypothetical protein Lesp02_33940 [Lentzea sp. NBRC 105346]|uniref:hypothetical protein n=1 Tax=Lentzea sp. NBRC 105346 TaxID=3032205 RepID=UPI0024A56F79|nr:hypothetical protein [Lentzea sp. NBRC 105346]GLZ31206.1 hypothetical protein Lesp02_33940 [Lentzea sp. NBRC 105346]